MGWADLAGDTGETAEEMLKCTEEMRKMYRGKFLMTLTGSTLIF